MLVAMTDAWAAGHLGQLQAKCPECTEDYIGKINDRNQTMADKFDALFRNGKVVFAAVGAIHFIEPMSLPRLLRKKGYWITRIRFDE